MPRRSLAIGLALLMAATGACGTTTPTMDPSAPPSTTDTGQTAAPASSQPTTSATASSGELPPDLLTAITDATLERLTQLDRESQADLDRRSGLTALVGPEILTWLEERRSEATVAALLDADIDPSSIGATRLSSEPIASLDGALVAEGYSLFGPGMATVGLVSGSATHIGGNAFSNSGQSFSQFQTTIGDRRISTTLSRSAQVSVSGSRMVTDVVMTETDVVTSVSTGETLGESTITTKTHVEVDMCPDANGVVPVTITQDVSGSGSSAGSTATTSTTQTVQATVGEDAYRTGDTTSIDATVEETGPTGTRRGSMSAGWTSSRGSGGGATSASGYHYTASGDDLPGRTEAGLGLLGALLTSIVTSVLDQAEAAWRGGKCVRLEATERSRKVRPREVVTFTAQPYHKIDGSRLNKPVVATFSGQASVSPVDTPVAPPPASFTFTAAPTKKTGRIELTSTSNRGIGTLTIQFEVEFQGWSISGSRTNTVGATGTLEGKKCGSDPMGAWTLRGTYSFMEFDGRQAWDIEITDSSIPVDVEIWTGTYRFRDRSKGPRGVTQKIDSSGTVKLVLDPDNGNAIMTLTRTWAEQTASAPPDGWGLGIGPRGGTITWGNDAQC